MPRSLRKYRLDCLAKHLMSLTALSVYHAKTHLLLLINAAPHKIRVSWKAQPGQEYSLAA